MSLILLVEITAVAAVFVIGIMLLFLGPKAAFLYRILFREAQDSIFVMTARKTTNLNKAALKLFGISRKDVKCFVPYEFSPPFQPDGSPSREKALAYVRKALNGEPQNFIWVHQNKGGKPFDAQVCLNRFHFLGRSYLLAIVRDITRERAAYNSVVREEERFKTLFEHFPVGISEQDFSEAKRKLEEIKAHEGEAFTTLKEYFSRHPVEVGECIDGMRFLAANTTALRIFGAETLEELAENRRSIVGPETEELYIREMEAILAGASHFEGEAFYRDLQGKKVYIKKHWV
ncbi:MAG TPA: PAS domain S-box protein, partial [Firmicutes bacterium]|nr:PAS domain S-box protein [Bacillota bacterium]